MIGFGRARGIRLARADGGRARSSWLAARQRAEAEAHRAARAALDPGASRPAGPRAAPPDEQTGAPVPGTGRPLDPAHRAFFERRLGADLSRVRLHDDAAAARAADAEHARGYAVGEDVVLAPDADREVLAHELVHVLQQRRAGRTAVQRDDRDRHGPGSAPPSVPFDVVRERAPSEDALVLFRQDSLALSGIDLSRIAPQLRSGRPLVVDVDGYASAEGSAEYNLNLSAHRAAAVRAVLLSVLPEGSTIRLHAHGSTAEFGAAPAPNRRVGIRVVEAPPVLVPPSGTPGGYRRHLRLVPDLQLHLDPALRFWPPRVLPPVTTLQLDQAPLVPGSVVPELFPPRVPPTLPTPPVPPVQLFPRLPPPRSIVDWGALRNRYVEHGAGPIDPRDAELAERLTQRSYDLFRSGGLPDAVARDLANRATRSAIGRELAREGNTAADRVDNELRRQGLPTPIGGSVDLLDVLRRLRGEKGGGGR